MSAEDKFLENIQAIKDVIKNKSKLDIIDVQILILNKPKKKVSIALIISKDAIVFPNFEENKFSIKEILGEQFKSKFELNTQISNKVFDFVLKKLNTNDYYRMIEDSIKKPLSKSDFIEIAKKYEIDLTLFNDFSEIDLTPSESEIDITLKKDKMEIVLKGFEINIEPNSWIDQNYRLTIIELQTMETKGRVVTPDNLNADIMSIPPIGNLNESDKTKITTYLNDFNNDTFMQWNSDKAKNSQKQREQIANDTKDQKEWTGFMNDVIPNSDQKENKTPIKPSVIMLDKKRKDEVKEYLSNVNEEDIKKMEKDIISKSDKQKNINPKTEKKKVQKEEIEPEINIQLIDLNVFIEEKIDRTSYREIVVQNKLFHYTFIFDKYQIRIYIGNKKTQKVKDITYFNFNEVSIFIQMNNLKKEFIEAFNNSQ